MPFSLELLLTSQASHSFMRCSFNSIALVMTKMLDALQPLKVCFEWTSHRIHGTGPVYLPTDLVDFYGINVGKYAVRPMDPNKTWIYADSGSWSFGTIDHHEAWLQTGGYAVLCIFGKKCSCFVLFLVSIQHIPYLSISYSDTPVNKMFSMVHRILLIIDDSLVSMQFLGSLGTILKVIALQHIALAGPLGVSASSIGAKWCW